MGVIIPNKINLEHLKTVETVSNYKISYNLKYINTNGLIFLLNNITINEYPTYYKIIINNNENIELLKKIDEIFVSTVSNYRPILKYDKSNYYITIKQNVKTSYIIKHQTDKKSIYINLIKIIKYAFHSNVIIYIL
tara:strand:- start:632 stop:1039 length:408 start_codon:yes stop_codon:yes gene_type:complete